MAFAAMAIIFPAIGKCFREQHIKPPPEQNKLDFWADEELLASWLYNDTGMELSAFLNKKVNGISPLLAANIPLMAGLSADIPIDTMGVDEIGRIYQQLVKLRQMLSQGNFDPVILTDKDGLRDYYVFALPTWNEEKTTKILFDQSSYR